MTCKYDKFHAYCVQATRLSLLTQSAGKFFICNCQSTELLTEHLLIKLNHLDKNYDFLGE